MDLMRVFVDSSTLVALLSIGRLELLRDLLDEVCVTPEVVAEVTAKEGPQKEVFDRATGSWIRVVKLKGDTARYTRHGLGRGEASIFLSKDRLVIDDRIARTLARAEGREFVGLLGLMVAGVETRRLKRREALKILDELVESDFRISTPLYKELRNRWA